MVTGPIAAPRNLTSTPAPELMTAEAFLGKVQREGKQELVRGKVIDMSPVGNRHGRVSVRVASRMLAAADASAAGEVLVETGFVLVRNPDTVRAPDVAYVSRARHPQTVDGFIDGPPDIAVEVISPEDRVSEVNVKVREYLDAGAQAVVVVDPKARVVHVERGDGTGRVLRGDDVLSLEDVLPGFALRLTELFAD